MPKKQESCCNPYLSLGQECKEEKCKPCQWYDPFGENYDIVLRFVNHYGWLGLYINNDTEKELYRTGGFHETREIALARVITWIEKEELNREGEP